MTNNPPPSSCLVSVIVPVFNEAGFIDRSLRSIALAAQKVSSEILVMEGGSIDGTPSLIEDMRREFPTIRILANPKRKQVFGLNLGILAAKGRYIVRCDAHAVYPQDYFANFVRFFEGSDSTYGNIGVAYETQSLARGIRAGIGDAMQSPFGVGGSHRVPKAVSVPRRVDTVLFGAWPATIFKQIGLFDENFVRGQDYEHNMRIIKSGRIVAQIPGDKFVYYTRDTYANLARMIGQYAYVKGQLLALTGRPANIRSAMPAGALVGAILLLPFPRILLVLLAVYVVAALAAATKSLVSHRNLPRALGMLCALPTMHAAHALGFLRGLVNTSVFEKRANSMESTR